MNLSGPLSYPLSGPLAYPLAPGQGVGGKPYAGVGDVLSGWSAFWGLMAYSKAVAGGNAADIVRASDSTSQTIKTLANGGADSASIAAFLAATTGKGSKLYDQVAGSFPVSQATSSARPSVTQNIVGTLPGLSFARASSQFLETAVNLALSAPTTMYALWRRTGTLTLNNGIMGAVGANYTMGAQGNVARTYLYCGTFLGDETASSDNTFHASAAVSNGASSKVYEDGATSSTGDSGSGTPTGHFRLGNNSFGDLLDGDLLEAGVYPGALTAGQAAAVIANARARWGLV